MSPSTLSFRRIAILCGDDLVHALTSLKGWGVLIPFFLFWFWILDKLRHGAAVWLQTPEGLALASWIMNPDLALLLFKAHPPTLSAFYVIALYTLPLFAMLVSCNQLAGDAGSGYFRFLLSRCTRDEILLGRLHGALLLTAAGSLLVGLAAAMVALATDHRQATEVMAYAFHVNLVLLAYLIPWVFLMTLLSAACRSAAGCFFSMIMLFLLVKSMNFIVRLQWPQLAFLSHVLPDTLTGLLLRPDASAEMQAILVIPIYALGYMTLALYQFRRRNL